MPDAVVRITNEVTRVVTAGTQGPQGPAGPTGPAGGSAAPGGSGGQIQFNNSGAFAGASGVTHAPAGTRLTITSGAGVQGLVLDGVSTNDRLAVVPTDSTARTFRVLPDGSVFLAKAVSGNTALVQIGLETTTGLVFANSFAVFDPDTGDTRAEVSNAGDVAVLRSETGAVRTLGKLALFQNVWEVHSSHADRPLVSQVLCINTGDPNWRHEYYGGSDGNVKVRMVAGVDAAIQAVSGFQILWSANSVAGWVGPDTGLARPAAGVVRVTDGQGGDGRLDASGLTLSNLPTSDPGVAGRVWRSGSDLKVSTG